MGDWVVDQLIDAILDWFAETIVGGLNALWDLLSATVFVSPDVTALPQVTAFASTSLGIVNICYVLAFLWMAILVMGRDTIQSQVRARRADPAPGHRPDRARTSPSRCVPPSSGWPTRSPPR